jgi:hypothetical protein
VESYYGTIDVDGCFDTSSVDSTLARVAVREAVISSSVRKDIVPPSSAV